MSKHPDDMVKDKKHSTLTTSETIQHIDLTAVLRASQTISEEIVFDKLLQDTMKIAIQNAGARKGFLILEKNNRLFIEVKGYSGNDDAEILNSIPVESSQELSTGIINYVKRTKEPVVLHNASEEGLFISDPYVVKKHSKSILCIPVVKQKRLSGILYLENDLLTNAFTKDRLEVLSILATQAAISIENAKLYKDSEQRVVQLQKAEKQIRDALREKEVLLREIHHRVKNNMQVISSMLNLQSRHMRDKRDIEMLKDSQNRIRSMALVHEKLYGSKDLAHVNFNEYINELAKEILSSHETSLSNIILNIKAEDIWLGIDTAIPCGLIISELISNALKYAFPEGKKGEITIKFQKTDKGGFELIVSDNGIGIPEGLDLSNIDSTGLRLVVTLSENQLQGKIKLSRTNGTEFKLNFTEIIYKKRI